MRPAPPAGHGRALRHGKDFGRAARSVGNRELRQPRTRLTGKPVTESNLSLCAPAQIPAQCMLCLALMSYADMRCVVVASVRGQAGCGSDGRLLQPARGQQQPDSASKDHGQILNHTTRVRAPVSVPSATLSPRSAWPSSVISSPPQPGSTRPTRASGLINTSQQIGGAIGLSVSTTIAADHTAALLHSGHRPAVALTAGFHDAFAVTGALVLAAVAVAAALIRRQPAALGTAPHHLGAAASRSWQPFQPARHVAWRSGGFSWFAQPVGHAGRVRQAAAVPAGKPARAGLVKGSPLPRGLAAGRGRVR